MTARLTKRLDELTGELERGQQMLAALEAQKIEVRDALLRISGAVQVLKEELQVQEALGSPLDGQELLVG